MDFEEVVDRWTSNDAWQFASKEAAWGYFFMAGRESQQGVISAQCVKMNQYEDIISGLRAQVAELQMEKEYRYVEQILSPIRRLLKVAGAAESMANDFSMHVLDSGGEHVIVEQSAFNELSEALDSLDELPDDKPGYVLGGAAKAAWALHDIIGDTNG